MAYSGGLDSTALLHLLALSLKPEQLAAAHLNHQLRGIEADADQSFAEQTARSLGLCFISKSEDVSALARSRRKGLEEAARKARYRFLCESAVEWSADFVVTAHQADDQAETVLMSLIKGGGAGGLAGIHPRRIIKDGRCLPAKQGDSLKAVELLRPLLPFTRQELREWLVDRGLDWVEDLSNNDRHYLRNAVRQDVAPILRRLNPGLVQALGRTAAILRGEEDFWAGHLADLWARMVDDSQMPETIRIDRKALRELSLAEQRRLIYEGLLRIWRGRDLAGEPLSFTGVETVLSMLAQTRHPGLDLPGGVRAEVSAGSLCLSLASRFKSGAGGFV